MSAIGKTKLDDNEDISALLGQQMKTDKPAEKMIENISEPEQTKAISKDDDKLKHNRSAKFTDSEAEQLGVWQRFVLFGTTNLRLFFILLLLTEFNFD